MKNNSMTASYKAFYDNVLSKPGAHNHPELIARWGKDPASLETQILCHKTGSPRDGGKMYEQQSEWGLEIFGPARWPYNAMDHPNYSDPPIQYNIRARLKAIGSTWWDWKNKRSIGLGYDFDSLLDHSELVGIPQEEIDKLDHIDAPWLEVIKSTQGNGRHIYIWFDPEQAPACANHNEHKAIARSFLPLIAQATGLDMEANVDHLGEVLWFHHANATEENQGYALMKPATQFLTAAHVPPNWRDNLEVVSGSRSKVRVQGWTADGTKTEGDELDEMTQAHARIDLDEAHLKVLEALEQTGHSSLWVGDHHLWQGHTGGLKEVFDEFEQKGAPLRGLFETDSAENDKGKPNCFMRPKLGGAWDVYRFGDNCPEHELWGSQGKFTHITYNYPATLRQIALACGGFEAPDGKSGYMFTMLEEVEAALKLLESKIEVPRGVTNSDGRSFGLRPREDGKLILVIGKTRSDKPAEFPRFAKTSKGWERVIDDAVETSDKDIEDAEMWGELDDKFRCLKADGMFESWIIKDSEEDWVIHPKENIKSVLVATGFAKTDPILGGAILKSWTLINMPFGPEYPGGRKWNRNAPQFVYPAVELDEGEAPYHPTWDRLMNHCGSDLDTYVAELPWCIPWGIHTGGDYLKAWVACMFNNPYGKLPYLFMYGPQNSGKSSFHESLRLLMTGGVEGADRALTSKQGYNGELNGVVLAVVDEVDINKAGSDAYNKLKEWTMALDVSIHAKYKQPKSIRSTLHFVQMANSRSSLPVFPGDTRITAMNVPSLEEEIPKDEMQGLLKKEAPHFMRTLYDWEIQPPSGRIMLPLIVTQGKCDAADLNQDALGQFISSNCFEVDGAAIRLQDFATKFHATLEDYQTNEWGNSVITKDLSDRFPIGRGKGNVTIIGNLSFIECEPSAPYIKEGKRLVREKE